MLMNYAGLREGLRHLLDEAYDRASQSAGVDIRKKNYREWKRAEVKIMLSEIFPEKG